MGGKAGEIQFCRDAVFQGFQLLPAAIAFAPSQRDVRLVGPILGHEPAVGRGYCDAVLQYGELRCQLNFGEEDAGAVEDA